MDDPDIPWFYLAMVAIIFVRWLLGQFKRAAKQRQEMRRQSRKGWDEHTPESVKTPPARPEAPPEEPQPEQPQTLQELFERRRQAIAEAQRQATTPPPIPVKKQTVAVAGPRPEVVVTHASTPAPALKRKSLAPRINSHVVTAFSDQKQVRNAFILKEILDPPKGFDL